MSRSPALAGLCNKATVSPSTGSAPLSVRFEAGPVEGCERNRDKQFWLVDNVPQGNSLSWSKIFETPGEHTWDFCSWLAGCEQCCDGGTIRVAAPTCRLDCTATAQVSQPGPPLVVDFAATATPLYCPAANLTYSWTFGDVDTSSQAMVTHEYAGPGPYNWNLEVRYGQASCQRGGIVKLDCLQVGQLRICADAISNEPASPLYRLSGNVRINDSLWFSGDVFYEARPEPDYGTLVTTGSLFVKSMGGSSTLVEGTELTFEVRGDERALHPIRGNPDFYVFDLGGLPLPIVGERPLVVGSNHVKLATLAWVGIPGLLDLARLETEVTFPNGGDAQLTRFEAVAGSVTKSISFAEITGTYDPRNNKLDMNTVCRFPFSGGASFAGKFGFERCGPNLLDLTLGGLFPDGIPITPPGVPLRFRAGKDLVVRAEHICDRYPFLIYLGTRATLCLDIGLECLSIPGEFFRINDLGAGYQHPLNFDIRGGTPTVLGYPIASARGKIQGNQPPYGVLLRGNANLAGFLNGAIDVAVSFSRALVTGSMRGALQVPNFACSPNNVPCKVVKNALKRVAGPLPASFADVAMTLNGRADTNTWNGTATGNLDVGPLRLVALIQLAPEGGTLQVGTNYASMYAFNEARAGSTASGFERQANLTAPTNDVLFGFVGRAAPPTAYLVAPDGTSIRADNVNSIPGAFYAQDAEEHSTVFYLPSIAPGLWTLGVSDASSSDVAITVLGPQAAPEAWFESVGRQGDRVDIAARFAPGRTATTAALSYVSASGGGISAAIPSTVDSASGRVTAAWDLSGLGTDTYFLRLEVDDGINPPTTVNWSQSLVVDRGSIASPAGLVGRRLGSAVDLRWDAAPGANVAGYNVLYGDGPGPGYDSTLSVVSGTSAVVSDLDPSTVYRFVVVAYDDNRQLSLPSNQVTVRTGSHLCGGDCDGDSRVTPGELMQAVSAALRAPAAFECSAVDADGDNTVSVDEIVLAVGHAIAACPIATPTPTRTVTALPTTPATAAPSTLPTSTPTLALTPTRSNTPTRTVPPRSATPTSTPSVGGSPTPTPTAPTVVYCSEASGQVDIPDDDDFGVASTIFVDAPVEVERLAVEVWIEHSWVGDLVLTLTRIDDFASIFLLDRPGYPSSSFGCGEDDIRCRFEDAALSPAENECADSVPSLQGSLRPTDPLAALVTGDLAGTWQLGIADLSPGDTGRLIEWCLRAERR